MAREAPQHITRWAGQDYRTSKVHLYVLRTGDWELGYLYRILMDALPEKGGVLPADPFELAADLGMPEEAITRCLPILERFGRGQSRGGVRLHSDGTLDNRRVSEDLAKARKLRRKLSVSGRRGGVKSAKARVKPGLSQAEPTLNLPMPLASASASASEPLPLPVPPPTPSPLPLPVAAPDGVREQAIPNDQAEIAFRSLLRAYPPDAVRSVVAAEHAFSQRLPSLPKLADLLDTLARQKRSDEWRRGMVPDLVKWLLEFRWTGTVGATAARGSGEEVGEQLEEWAKAVDG